MKKLLISLLTATMLTTGCTQAKEIGKIDNIENKIEENIGEKSLGQTRKEGIEFIDLFLKENLSDCYDGYYADENGITIKFVDDGIVELLEVDEELYEKFVELNLNVYKQASDILKTDEDYHICVTYTDRHKGENATSTNTFFVIVDGKITYNTVKR